MIFRCGWIVASVRILFAFLYNIVIACLAIVSGRHLQYLGNDE